MKKNQFVIVGLGLFLIGAGSYFKHDRNSIPPMLDSRIDPQSVSTAVWNGAPSDFIPLFSIRGAEFEAIIADTPALRERGLSGMASLNRDQAMVFIFERPEIVGFWMKDVLFSIDMLFVDENMRVISSARDVSPDTYPEVFYPKAPVKYVVEFLAGTLDRLGVEDGDIAEIRL